MRQGKPGQSGFSVIELLVVVALILLIAAIALPNLFGARKKATEASAVASIKAIHLAESIYQNTYPDKGYSPSLIYLGSNGSTCETLSPTNACLIDPVLASGIKDGYVFDLLGDGNNPDQTYTLKATPQTPASCSFTSDQTGVIQSGSIAPPPGISAGGGSGSSGSCGATY
jgi:type IV pilus assembly protein PilA